MALFVASAAPSPIITTLGNEGSVRFHQALGWSLAEVENYAGPGRSRIVFTKDLANR